MGGDLVPGSKPLTLRQNRAQHTNVGYFGAYLYWVCQEYSTNREYVFSLLFFMIVHCELIELHFLWLSFAWASIKRVFHSQKDWSTRDQGPPSLICADRCLLLVVWVFLIICTAVIVLWHPVDGLKKELVWVSVFLIYWMTSFEVCWSGFSASCWQECSTALLPWVAVRKKSSRNITFSLRGQHLCFGRISLLVACGQAEPDMEHWGWYPSILLIL